MQAAAQPTASLSTAHTTPSYLGGLISVRVGVQNLASVVARVSRVEVHFDWLQTLTDNVPVMIQPGETHEWAFSDCASPERTWAGKHSYDTTVLIAWADSSGGWSQDSTGALKTEFTVEQPPPAQVYTFSGATLALTVEQSPPPQETASSSLLALLLIGALLVGAVIAIKRQKPQTSVRTDSVLDSKPTTSLEVETGALRECKVCHNVNPPYAERYCVKCGGKLE
jgi:hypothetical protein